MWHSVDLFTGIGGFALAFDGLCKPLLYCDAHPVVLSTLRALTASGQLPVAPIVDDVRKLSDIVRVVNRKKVHLLTAGFPCTGFSGLGDKHGFRDSGSGLFFVVLQVIKALSPVLVMFENVPGIVTAADGRDLQTVISNMKNLGYRCAWTVCSAAEVGLPQRRARWFCLCVKGSLPALPQSAWTARDGVTRPARRPSKLLVPRAENYESRFFMLGNTVVPETVKLAFRRLYAELSGAILSKLAGVRCTEVILLDPGHGTLPDAPPSKVTASRINAPMTIHSWPTPRATGMRHSNYLSGRNYRDLATAARFAAVVNGTHMPKPKRNDTINPSFVEWLMGFPKNWTKCAPAGSMRTKQNAIHR